MAQSPTALITISPEIMSGTPVFSGTRVPIKTLLDYLRGGDTIDAFLDDFPTVERAQVDAVLAWIEVQLVETLHARAA